MGALLEVDGVTRLFGGNRGGPFARARPEVRAVEDVSLAVRRGRCFGIVGESGSGKTTLSRMMLRLDEPTSGRIRFDGRDLGDLDRRGLLAFRRRVQPVFQDATASLNPRMRLRELVAEPLLVQPDRPPREQIDRRVADLLTQVGLRPNMMSWHPHQLSGGQRQRVAIARALVVDPDLLILDEPVSALDVSIQSQVLNLLLDLRDVRALTYVMIAHDLAMMRHVADELAVMQHGRIVESGPAEQVFAAPQHPYTRALLAAVPAPPVDPARSHGTTPSGVVGARPVASEQHEQPGLGCPATVGDGDRAPVKNPKATRPGSPSSQTYPADGS